MSDANAGGIIHTETISLLGTPAQIRRFIMTPERILDYFPGGEAGEVLEEGKAILCRGGMASSILEILASESNEECLVVKVTSAMGLEAPFTRERVEANTMFTMIEDWHLTPNGEGTTLQKTWRDIKVVGEAPFDVEDAVRQGAQHETGALIQGWDRAAEAERAQ